ncbi:MAG: hypothetical protein WCR45_11445, partial [Bacteroidaceae bacterium]
MNTNLRLLRIFFFTLFVLALTACATEPPRDFSIEGNSVRNAVVAKVKGENLLYISELDGAISCYTVNGQKLWRNETQNPAVMFEINAADIDQDGNEDVLAASGDGTLYAWGSDGQLLWKFHPQPRIRLSEVATIGKGDKMRIFTGGNNYILYELNNKGEKLSETPIKGVIRKLESGNFIDANKEVLF